MSFIDRFELAFLEFNALVDHNRDVQRVFTESKRMARMRSNRSSSDTSELLVVVVGFDLRLKRHIWKRASDLNVHSQETEDIGSEELLPYVNLMTGLREIHFCCSVEYSP